MFKLFLKLFLVLSVWGIFVWVLLYVEPPASLTQATPLELSYFFIPLFISLTFTFNLFLDSLYAAGSLTLGLLFLLILKSLDLFNFLYVSLTLLATFLLVSYFLGDKLSLKNLSTWQRKRKPT